MAEELRGVSRTAVWVAMMRTAESIRSDRLFEDPLAGVFVAAAWPPGAAPGAEGGSAPPGANEFLAIRTRFYDDYLLAAGARQVVILAAGLDSRAFRLDWPGGVRLFELDLPELFEFKEPVLAGHGAVPRCVRVPVPVDLRADWSGPLADAGFDPAVPTVWLAEGVLLYLSMADNDRLVSTLNGLSAPGSHLAFDHMDSSADSRPVVRQTFEMARKMGADRKSTLDDPVGWLAGHGWRGSTARIPALATGYGRPLPEHVDLVASNATILCTGTAFTG